jgi:hypothetical protein
LKAHGIVARRSPLRPSEYETLRNDPFAFYLRSRLGITPWRHSSEALNVGRWVHLALEAHHLGMNVESFLDKCLDEEVARLREAGEEAGATDTNIEYTIEATVDERVKGEAFTNAAWYYKPIPPQYKALDSEVLLYLPLKAALTTAPSTLIQTEADLLLYNEEKREVWVQDTKTCSEAPEIRASTATWEYQTKVMRLLVTRLIESRVLQQRYNLHPGYAKAVYMERCEDWYFGRNEFKHFELDRQSRPPVDISYVRWGPSEPVIDPEFEIQLREHAKYATQPAYPDRFPRSSSWVRKWESGFDPATGVSPLGIFYPDDSIVQWPAFLGRDSSHTPSGYLLQYRDWPPPPGLGL